MHHESMHDIIRYVPPKSQGAKQRSIPGTRYWIPRSGRGEQKRLLPAGGEPFDSSPSVALTTDVLAKTKHSWYLNPQIH